MPKNKPAPKAKSTPQLSATAVYEAGYKIYQTQGVDACVRFATKNGITKTAFCEPCEETFPVTKLGDDQICFVCGTITEQP